MASEYQRLLQSSKKKLESINFTPYVSGILAGVLLEISAWPAAERNRAVGIMAEIATKGNK